MSGQETLSRASAGVESLKAKEETHFLDLWRSPKGWRGTVLGLVIFSLICGIGVLVYVTGGTTNVWAHLMYVPILLAAAAFRIPGGLMAALVGGAILGPYMPLDLARGLAQSPANWCFRLGYFLILGAGSGWVSAFLNRQIDRLKRAQGQLQYILDNTRDVIFQVDLKGNYIYANAAAEPMTGYALGQLLRMNMMDMAAPEFHDQINMRMLRRPGEGQEERAFEIEFRRKDGERIWTELTTGSVKDPTGEVVALQCVARNITERKKAAEATTLFRALLDHGNDAIEIIDPESGRFLDVNEKACSMHGFTRAEYLALAVPGLAPHYTQAGNEFWPSRVDMLRRFGFQNFETFHQRKDGAKFPVEVNASYIRLERDYILGVVRDLTDRKKAEHRIRQLNRVYAVLSGINELIVRERDPQRLFEGACRIAVDKGGFALAWIGLSTESSRPLELRAHAGATPDTLKALNLVFNDPKGGCAFTLKALQTGAQAVCNDVEHDPLSAPWRELAMERSYRALVSMPLAVAGQIVGAFNLYATEAGFFDADELRLLNELALDIGFALETHQLELKRQAAEQELRAREERFRLLTENASDVILVLNGDGVVRYISPSVTRILGHAPEDLQQKSVFEFLESEDSAGVAALFRRLLAEPATTAGVEFRIRHRDASWRIFHAIGRNLPEQAPDGFMVLNARDITDSRKLEEQFRQSQKMEAIGQLAGGVAHDFNNILAAMMMQADMLATTPGLATPVAEGLEQISGYSERAANLTRQLLLFSRKQVMRTRHLNLSEVAVNLAKMLQRIVGESYHLELELSETPVLARADAGMLDQVLLNLVVNARDAMPGGGAITLATGRKTLTEQEAAKIIHGSAGNYVFFRVSDTGCGIAPENMQKIFEPFFTTKEPGKGTGLGLATVFGIVQQHQGVVSVESELGRGTTFIIYLPATTARESDMEDTTIRRKMRHGTESILLVEDEPAVRRLTRECLEKAGYQVRAAANGVEALQIWRRQELRFDLLFTDLVMPDAISGWDLAARLRQEDPQIKVVFVSGYSSDHASRELELQKGQAFLQKPFSPNQVLDTVRACLDA